MSHSHRLHVAVGSLSLCLLGLWSCSAERAPLRSADEFVRAPAQESEPTSKPTPTPTPPDEVTGARKLGPKGPKVLIGSPPRGDEPELSPGGPSGPDDALLVTVSTPYQILEGAGTYVHVAAWQPDGKPARLARVYVGKELMGTTNDQGALVFLYPPTPTATGALVHGDLSVVDAKQPNRRGQVQFKPKLRAAGMSSDQVFVYAERGVYEPGELIRLRTIAWRLDEDYTPLTERETTLSLVDGMGKVWAGATLTTDDFGVAAGSLALPAGAPEGRYELRAKSGATVATSPLQVRELKVPRYEMAHTIRRFVLPEQTSFDFEVTLSSPRNEPLDSLTLGVRSVSRGVELFSLPKMKVNGPGPHKVSIKGEALERLRSRSMSTFVLSLEGPGGVSDELEREVYLTSTPYVAVLEPDKEQYTQGEQVKLVVKMRDLDGVPARGVALRLDVGGPKALVGKTDAHGVALFDFPMPEQALNVSLFVDDVSDAVSTRRLAYVPKRPMLSKIEQPRQIEHQESEVVVRFPADIEPVEGVVHMDIVDTSGAIVQSVLVPIEQTPQGPKAQTKFRAPSWGSMLLTFFALGRRRGAPTNPDHPYYELGLLTEGQSLVVHPNRTLEVLLDGVPDELKPGQEAELEVQVRDAQGQPARVALGASMVDGGLISLKDPLEITPMDHFYDPTLRTMSTTGAKMLTWPVVSRNWGIERRDVALPPFLFKSGGGVEGEGVAGLFDSPTTKPQGLDDAKLNSSGAKYKKAAPKKRKMAKSGIVVETGRDGSWQELKASQPSRPTLLKPPPEEPKPKVTIRTGFVESALWLPSLRGTGSAKFKVRAPETISSQELVVVASDHQGGVGLARKRISVTQEVFIQADLPAIIRAGEQVKVPLLVQNNTDQGGRFEATLDAPGLEAKLLSPSVELGPREQGVIWAQLSPKEPGDYLYTAKLVGAGHEDTFRASARVLPSGVPIEERWSGRSDSKSPFTLALPAQAGAEQAQTTLSVVFPVLTASSFDFARFERALKADPLSMSADLTGAALLLRIAQQQRVGSEALDRLRSRVLSGLLGLSSAQASDGSFSYWRSSAKPSVMVTAWALEGALEAKSIGLPVSSSMISLASQWLAKQLGPTLEIDVSEIAYWEGDSEQVKAGLRAQIFDIITRIPERERDAKVNALVARMASHFKDKLREGKALDPLMSAHAISGLLRIQGLSKAETGRLLDELMTQRVQGHWESSWFHVLGGQIELNAAMISLIHAVDPKLYVTQQREALDYILKTQPLWGSWHNERGSSAALRALALVGKPPESLKGQVSVLWRGQEIKRVELGEKDPFMSTLELAALDLPTPDPTQGGELEVRVKGLSQPQVAVHRKVWPKADARAAASDGALSLKVSAKPKSLSVGQRGELVVELKGRGLRRIGVSRSALMELDLTLLNVLIAQIDGVIRYHVDRDVVWIDVFMREERLELKLPIVAKREGVGRWPTISVDGVQVSAGALKVRP